MQKMIVVLMWAGIAASVQGQTMKSLEVIVQTVKSDEGVMIVSLFNSEKTFTRQVWKGEKPKAKPGIMKIIFENIPSGQFAIAVYHDANENGKLDSNFMGMPREGFGFSKDAMGTFGPPSFEKAMVTWTGAETFTINLKYY